MRDLKYLFITHRTYDNGKIKLAGIDQIIDFFIEKKATIFLVEHPIESDFFISFLKKIAGEKKNILKTCKIWPQNEPWRWFGEILYSFFWVKNIIKKENVSIIFAVDALNVFSILPLKLFNKNLKIYFFSADYSDKRSNSYILNKIYKIVYNLSLKLSDKTFVVSNRIYDCLSPLYYGKIIFLPNSPLYDKIIKIEPDLKNKFSLVFCAGRLTERVNLEGIFFVVKILRGFYPQIILNLIGKFNCRAKELIDKYGIQNNIQVYNFLLHDETIKVISQSYVGISYYSENVSHIYWGDSLKIREYAAAGLPTVCDGITSTADEMSKYKAGFIIKSPEEMAGKIKKLIDSKTLYREIRESALLWANKMDKNRILEKTLQNKKD